LIIAYPGIKNDSPIAEVNFIASTSVNSDQGVNKFGLYDVKNMEAKKME
jgi:hypothetical protein